jgi:hypothetical protein
LLNDNFCCNIASIQIKKLILCMNISEVGIFGRLEAHLFYFDLNV